MADAHRLIEAFTSMILPIVRAHVPTTHRPEILRSGPNEQQDIINVNYSFVAPEARQLLSALENFITAVVVGSQSAKHDLSQDRDVPTEDITLASEVHSVLYSVPASRETYEEELTTVEHPAMLKSALDRVRYRVYNTMPIRLLAFDSNGLGIELLERSEILDRISNEMIAEFYTKYKSDHSFPWNVPDTDPLNSIPEKLVKKYADYAILSHTWLRNKPGEVTYAHWTSGKFDVRSPGYQKLANFCRVAATTYGTTFGWMDTICINKDSSAELDESIRSMYKWYRDARICIAYLAETTDLQLMHMDTWFTRGWTLQEMLAPGEGIKFNYGANWCPFSGEHEIHRNDSLILDQIQRATTITPNELRLFPWMSLGIPISRRMQWAANRHVTRTEDVAYSLMGIFDVDMSIAYGEGSERAIIRLAKEILMSPHSTAYFPLDIANRGSGPGFDFSQSPSSLIPTSIKDYLYSADANIHWPPLRTPISLTNFGLCLSVLIMHAVKSEEMTPANPIGNYYATVTINPAMDHLRFSPSIEEHPMHFNILDKASPVQSGFTRLVTYPTNFDRSFFGVLNFGEEKGSIFLPANSICFAVCLYSNGSFDTGNFKRITTQKAITFPLQQVQERRGPIRKSELAKHGMQLVTMYL